MQLNNKLLLKHNKLKFHTKLILLHLLHSNSKVTITMVMLVQTTIRNNLINLLVFKQLELNLRGKLAIITIIRQILIMASNQVALEIE